MKTYIPKTSKNLKSISRMDVEAKRTHGWYVKIYYRGKAYTKLFSDKKYGGKDRSLKAAIKWRNDEETRIGKPRSDLHIRSVSNTYTGVVGVNLNDALNRFVVTWVKPDGKPGRTTVSIRKYGRKAAFAKACKIREDKEAERLSAR